jgi:hypothetical protein
MAADPEPRRDPATPETPEEFDDTAELEAEFDAVSAYDSHTERLGVYSSLLPVLLPPIGTGKMPEAGEEPKLDRDVRRYRNFALVAIFADIRRIAGDGLEFRVDGEDAR